jgi:kynurenine formamidase
MTDTRAPAAYDGNGPSSPEWWPSRYGAGDEVGAGNELTPERTLAALRIPREGRIIELAQLLEPGIPAYPPRRWHQLLLAHNTLEDRTHERGHVTRPSSIEEHVTSSYQIGCHLDGLGHVGVAGRFYNGLHYREIFTPTGLTRLGIEHAPQWVARGVCLDIAALEGTTMLEEGFAITPEHLEAACRRQGVEIGAGDVVLLHTGWSELWMVDNARYGALEPGLGWDAAHWLTDRRISLAGADNWCLEVWPPEREGSTLVVHQHLLAETGTYILENLTTKPLVSGGISEFLFLLSPCKTRGSTASLAAPLAVV